MRLMAYLPSLRSLSLSISLYLFLSFRLYLSISSFQLSTSSSPFYFGSGQRPDGDERISVGPKRATENVGQADECDGGDGAGGHDHKHGAAVAGADASTNGERGGRGWYPPHGRRQRGHRPGEHWYCGAGLHGGGLHGTGLDAATHCHDGAADHLDERFRTSSH